MILYITLYYIIYGCSLSKIYELFKTVLFFFSRIMSLSSILSADAIGSALRTVKVGDMTMIRTYYEVRILNIADRCFEEV